MSTIEPKTLWNAVAMVMNGRVKPLEVCVVAEFTGLSEADVIATLMRYATSGRSITFRYPPIPCAAIVAITNP